MKKLVYLVAGLLLMGLASCGGNATSAAKKVCKACDNVMSFSGLKKCAQATADFEEEAEKHADDEAWLEAAEKELEKCDNGGLYFE